MKGKIVTWIVFAALLAGAVYWFYVRPKINARKLSYTYTRLTIGDIESIISSTGELEAINTIQVGTQISGTISKIYVDYNDKVKKGDLLAQIDVRLLDASLTNAKANLSMLDAKLHQAKDEYERNAALFKNKVITEKEFKDSQYVFEQAKSSRDAAAAALKSAEVNLNYAYIRSPIAGTITERTVEEGQTVAASFATPTLFVIAENLSKMQILADVDESDIGYIREGMRARFTVQTYPDRKFFGEVRQIRLQPAKINNVVNYKVVVHVDNREGYLLPGMTANIDFISESAVKTLLLNNSALRFHPTEEMLHQIKSTLTSRAKQLPDSVSTSFITALSDEEEVVKGGFRKLLPPKTGLLFFQPSSGQLDCEFVTLGITTGLQSEIKTFLSGNNLKQGAEVINGIKSNED